MRQTSVLLAIALLSLNLSARAADQPERKGDPYTLNVCPVSGETLGSMGDPVTSVTEGREIKLCCNACSPKFTADPAKYTMKIDSMMIEDQKPRYPLTIDIVSGELLPADGKVVDLVYFNRLVRFGSQQNAQAFTKSPEQYLAKLNEAVIEKQKEKYPTDKCPVTGSDLDSMGKPVLKVYANRLVQFCCDNCPATFEDNPQKYLPLLEKGTAKPSPVGAHNEHNN